MGILDELLQLAEVFGDGLGRTREASVGLHVDGGKPATEELQKNRHEGAAGAAYTIESNTKFPFADSVHVQEWQRQNLLDVLARGVLVLRYRTKIVPCRTGNFPLDDLPHLGAFSAV